MDASIYSPMTETAFYSVNSVTVDSQALMALALQSMDMVDQYEILDVEEMYEVTKKLQNYL